MRATRHLLMWAHLWCPFYCILLLLLPFYMQTNAFEARNQTCVSYDLRALNGFSRSLDTKLYEWPVTNVNSTKCCSWQGVHCALFPSSTSSSSSVNSSMRSTIRVIGLDLSGMGLEGVLSRSMAGLDKLSFLNLSRNSFRGPIPPELFHLKLLEVLDLSSNRLSGELPPSIGNLSSLSYLDLSNNWFTGIIPDAFHALPKLEIFSAESNEFVGQLPASLSSCSMLTRLDLWNNSLDGRIDLDFARLVHLTMLNLGWNGFQGLIPEALSSCKALKILNLSRNNLSGQVPKKLSNLQSLSFMMLTLNSLSNISKALEILQECRNLKYLGLGGNFGGEEMPNSGIQGFQSIRVVGMTDSGLTGTIPLWLRNCRELRVLALSGNQLSGEVPSWLGRFDHLFCLSLSNNSLWGQIPVSLTELKSLTSGVLDHDRSHPEPFFYIWHTGKQPFAAWGYKQYSDIQPSLILGNNKLNGSIWKEFGNLKYLHWLDLSSNNFSGSIPDELSSLVNLERLDLSFNNLSGIIPSSLTGLSFLSFFNVAYNQLQGLIPSEGQFLSFPCSSFEGNPGLYGNPLLFCNSTPNATYHEEGDDDDEDGIVFMGLPFAIALFVCFLPTFYLLMCCWNHNYNYD